ncbi:MAG: UDP-N-acetylglucosamine 2-epimerase [bacterium]|nr:UDP-N-acetylglucosamine 2-epimerase [bacterium]
MKRKICLVTGTRAEYGLSYPILRAIKEHSDLELQLVVTGMHLLPEHGNTIDLIKEDGFEVSHIVETINKSDDSGADMALAVAKCIEGVVKFFKKDRPDMVIAMTDLGFTLATAIAASHMNIPVAHVHGGEVSGSIDELVRHATTKLSHIHFTSSEKSAERIKKMGEEPYRVHMVGAPGLDMLLHSELFGEKELREKYNLNEDKYIVLVQHSVSTEVDKAGQNFEKTVRVIEDLGMQTILIYPNADAGSNEIIKVIESIDKDFIKSYKSLPRKDYLSLLKYASVLVGNSSSGILEAPSFHLPVVDIGTRQNNRERADNVVHVGYDEGEIKEAINFVLSDNDFQIKLKNCKNPYGDGTAGKQIANILAEIEIDKKLLEKLITY